MPDSRPDGPRFRIVGELDAVTRAAVDHVILGYDYLARRDLDGLLSLVEPDMSASSGCGTAWHGRDELEAHLGWADSCAMQPMTPELVVAVGPAVVVVTGTVAATATARGGPVVDTIVAGEHGLIRSCHRLWTDGR